MSSVRVFGSHETASGRTRLPSGGQLSGAVDRRALDFHPEQLTEGPDDDGQIRQQLRQALRACRV